VVGAIDRGSGGGSGPPRRRLGGEPERREEPPHRLLSIASTMGVALSEPDIRKTTEIVRQLSEDVKARSERLS
jgi:hypothetical protein